MPHKTLSLAYFSDGLQNSYTFALRKSESLTTLLVYQCDSALFNVKIELYAIFYLSCGLQNSLIK